MATMDTAAGRDARYGFMSIIQLTPLEVMERIFKHMASARISLSSCVLVSRSWAILAYPHRFEELVFSSTTGPQGAVWQEGQPKPAMRTCEDLIAFLRTSARVCALVESLFLRGDHFQLNLDVRCVPELIPLLPRLHTLEIANCQMMCTPRRLKLTELFAPCPLKMLQLGELGNTGSTNATICALAFVIACFDAVNLLYIEDLAPAFEDHNANWVLGVFFGTLVRKLEVSSDEWPEVNSALATLGQILDPTSLRELNLSAFDMRDTTEAQRFLRRYGKTVKRLHCGSFNECGDTHFDLAACASLEFLEVSVGMPCREIHPETYEQFVSDWSVALRTLQRAPETVKHMRLMIMLEEAGDQSMIGDAIEVDDVASEAQQTLARLSALDWSLLDDAIDAHPCLVEVEICLRLLVVFDEDESMGEFYKDVRALVEAKCFRTEKRKKLLNVWFPEHNISHLE